MGSRIENEFVPYQQALALKELGFDKPCFGRYDVPREFILSGCYSDSPLVSISVKQNDICEAHTLAPTFSQAFRWFREKYNVHFSPKRYDETKWWVEWGTWTSPVFETFEEAELACLNKLIEIVKQ